MRILSKAVLVLMLVFGGVSCKSDIRPGMDEETTVTGKKNLPVDETVFPVTEEWIEAFESSYPNAFLFSQPEPESVVFEELLRDSSRLAITTRPFNAKERSFLESKKFMLEEILLAKDAMCFLLNPNSSDTAFTTEQLKNIISGKDTSYAVVFERSGNSCLRFLQDSLLGGAPIGSNCFAAANADSVFNYVNRNERAIGVVAYNTISYKHRTICKERRAKIKLAYVGSTPDKTYKPNQSTIFAGQYPLTRCIWLLKVGKAAGLGTGFASFIMSDRGQLIVQKAGLAPAKPAERQVEININ
jgi:phosphate transport system substrate-binding protein